MAIAYMRLEGILQSYGQSDLWCDRGTMPVPTQSAVMGILGAMLGVPYGDARLAELANQIRMCVRINTEGGIVDDYHTMTARLPKAERDGIVFSNVTKLCRADGTTEVDRKTINLTGRTEIRHKKYLMDSSFTVFLECEDADLLQQLQEASLHPVYTPYLGRVCCMPSVPVLLRVSEYTSMQEALAKEDTVGLKHGFHEVYRYADDTQDDVYQREFIDVPLGSYQYGHRFVSIREVKV